MAPAYATEPVPETPEAHGSLRRILLFTLAILLAAATVTYSIAWMYYVRTAIRVEVGIDTDPVPEGMRVKDVWPDSPAERAGMHAGDVITDVNGQSTAHGAGQTVIDRIWFAAHPGETVRLTVQRPGQPQPIEITPAFRQMKGSGDNASLGRRGAVAVLRLYPLLFLAVGLPVLFLRIEDRNAWLLALVFAGLIAEADLPRTFSVAPDGLRQFLYAFVTIAQSVLPALFYFFFAVFPTRSPIDKRLPWLKWLLLGAGICFGSGGLITGQSGPWPMDALPFINAALGLHVVGLIRLVLGYGSVILGLASLLWNVVSVKDLADRRKLNVMLWGTLVGIAPAILIGIPYDLARTDIPFWLGFTRGTFLFLLPLSFAYAVMKHRVMDIPVLLRRSARYFLVERGFAVLMLIVSVGIMLWFGQAFSRRFSSGSKAAIPIGATLGVLLLSGATQVHRQVRTRLDRAFFRSAYDAQQILEDLAARALTVTDRAQLAGLLQQQIYESLHPTPLFVYLLADDGTLRAYAGDPPQPAATLSVRDEGMEEIAGRGEPFELNPAKARGTKLAFLDAECLVPIRGSRDRELQGLVVLGPRLSEEPYSARDRRLLASVATQAGIAMRSISLAEKMAERMEAERRSQQEMQIARQVQSRLLPQQAPRLATLDCAGKCIQTRAVGGDYYDFLDFGSGKLGLVLADISGKGMSAALLMANLQASLRGQYALALDDLPHLLRSVNTLFFKNTEPSHYATMFFAMYDDTSRTLRYVNCGHNAPILLRGAKIERLEATATVLGLFEKWDCQVEERRLSPGDVLLIYTDGVSEAAPEEDAEEFGEERLIKLLLAHRTETAEKIVEAIVDEVQRFSRGFQADDMTLIAARSEGGTGTDGT